MVSTTSPMRASIEAVKKLTRHQEAGPAGPVELADYVPYPSPGGSTQRRQARRRSRLRLHRRPGSGRKAVPAHAFRDHRHTGFGNRRQAEECRGSDLRVAAVRVSGGLPLGSDFEGQGLHDHLERRRPGHPVGNQLHRRLSGRRQGCGPEPEVPLSNGFSHNFSDPSDCETIASTPDQPGQQDRLPGGRRMRPRCIAGREAEGRLRDRR